MASTLQYSDLPERAAKAIENFLPDEQKVAARAKNFEQVKPRNRDNDGDTETLDRVTFTHHFIKTPGDYELVEWHYVTCGKTDATPIVFLHGIPDSWYQWHHQMSAFAKTHYCIGIDLKGYGQSDKGPGAAVHASHSDLTRAKEVPRRHARSWYGAG